MRPCKRRRMAVVVVVVWVEIRIWIRTALADCRASWPHWAVPISRSHRSSSRRTMIITCTWTSLWLPRTCALPTTKFHPPIGTNRS
uniref:Putative secreted peptide n=1 Tax=Anopheles braziliensis TaxID=58242 RepID=A0A2M3ZMR7_9DIPT